MTAVASYNHLAPPPFTAVSHGRPKTEPPRHRFGFLAPNPLPRFPYVNGRPYDRRRILQPPHATSLHRHFTRQTQNRATTAPFWVFGPQPCPPPRVCDRAARCPPWHPTSHPTTSHHLPSPPFHTAD